MFQWTCIALRLSLPMVGNPALAASVAPPLMKMNTNRMSTDTIAQEAGSLATPSPPPAADFAAGKVCGSSTGIRNVDVCCAAGCGTCGGAGCGSRPGGNTQCCINKILKEGSLCADESSTGCIVPTVAPMRQQSGLVPGSVVMIEDPQSSKFCGVEFTTGRQLKCDLDEDSTDNNQLFEVQTWTSADDGWFALKSKNTKNGTQNDNPANKYCVDKGTSNFKCNGEGNSQGTVANSDEGKFQFETSVSGTTYTDGTVAVKGRCYSGLPSHQQTCNYCRTANDDKVKCDSSSAYLFKIKVVTPVGFYAVVPIGFYALSGTEKSLGHLIKCLPAADSTAYQNWTGYTDDSPPDLDHTSTHTTDIAIACCDSSGTVSAPGCATGDYATAVSTCTADSKTLCTMQQLIQHSGSPDTACTSWVTNYMWTSSYCEQTSSSSSLAEMEATNSHEAAFDGQDENVVKKRSFIRKESDKFLRKQWRQRAGYTG